MWTIICFWTDLQQPQTFSRSILWHLVCCAYQVLHSIVRENVWGWCRLRRLYDQVGSCLLGQHGSGCFSWQPVWWVPRCVGGINDTLMLCCYDPAMREAIEDLFKNAKGVEDIHTSTYMELYSKPMKHHIFMIEDSDMAAFYREYIMGFFKDWFLQSRNFSSKIPVCPLPIPAKQEFLQCFQLQT